MCNPIIGAVVSAVGTIASAAQRSGVSRAQAKIARNNALVERQRAGFEAQRERDRLRRLVSSRRARTLASGVAIAGSPIEVIVDQVGQGEVGIANNRFEREVRARNFEADANIKRSNASATLFSSGIGAITPIIDKSRSLIS